VAGSCEYGDEPSGSGATGLVFHPTICEAVMVHHTNILIVKRHVRSLSQINIEPIPTVSI
jgi:hypothetical protein